MTDTLYDHLKASPIFSQLGEEVLLSLASHFTPITLEKGKVLFYQGDPSDSVFFLASGKLAAELTTVAKVTRIVNQLNPGDLVGELSVLSNDLRAFTIRALKESTVYKLEGRYFVDLCFQHPSVMFASVHPIIQRSNNIIHMLTAEKSVQHVVIIPANREVSLGEFSDNFTKLCESFMSLLVVSDYQAGLNEKADNIHSLTEKIHQLEQTKKSTHQILYILKSHDTPLARLALKKVDRLYIAVNHTSSPKIDSHIIDKLNSDRIDLLADPELIIFHQDNAMTPQNTSRWLSQLHFNLQHHIRIHNQKDLHRLLRFVRGKAVGLVLSGGGTRGWAHLGALKALKESKIPIDIIGGTSVGSLIGACYALHASYEEAFDKFFEIIEKSNRSVSWRNLTWPIVSLFNAEKFTRCQQDLFGDLQIEDMWLPYFCVSCNLATNIEDIHVSGTLWERTRASSSIPGIIPPMLINGELHFDGGLMNNLPVDIMRRFVGSKGKVVAIDLNSFAPDKQKYDFPPMLGFRDALFCKLGWGNNGYRFPRFIDTFMHGLFIGSFVKSAQNSLSANLFVSPNLSKFRLLHSNPKQYERLIEIGYEETMKKIPDFDHKG